MVNGCFKWSFNFHCLVEYFIFPIWVTLSYFPVHFIHCNHALFLITAIVGTPLRVDRTMSLVNKSFVARVLVEYDALWPLFSYIWIDEGEYGFDNIFFSELLLLCFL